MKMKRIGHEDFESHEVKEREGKRPLLIGDLQVTLKEGVGTIGELIFIDNSSWIRSRKLRLGSKVASGYCEAIRIREAKTKAFTVKDHRGECEYCTLQIFLLFLRLYRFVVRDPQKLQNILGSGMSNKMWESTIEHAKTCVLSGKLNIIQLNHYLILRR
ncbi:hypothetical protein SUGI_0346350 [Cryptomeria japonica]|nr:hypothetical protein SUGI_0346350 [Cryptomeria japonica]